MDIKDTMRQISEMEREKAQAELLAQQLKEQKAELERRLKDAGVTAENLDDKIAELESKIQEQLRQIKAGPASTTALKIPLAKAEQVSDALGILDI